MAEAEEYVGRAGRKLAAALDAFGVDAAGSLCADFGCNIGGFTDCLLRGGASKVYAVDTGYGQLAWRLRKDPRVVVLERTNALYAPVPEPVDLVVIDVGWTAQELVVPAAVRWLRAGGRIISLLKTHYEARRLLGRKDPRPLGPADACQVCLQTCRRLDELGCPVQAVARSPLAGKGGGIEFFLLLVGPGPPA